MSWYGSSGWSGSSRATSISSSPEEPLLADQTSDEVEYGWGERPVDPADSDCRRLTEDRPPHHDQGW